MITTDSIKKKMMKLWDSGKFLSSWCRGETIFPLRIPAGSARGSYLSENFLMITRWIEELVSSSKIQKDKGFSIEFTSVTHRQLGAQKLPSAIVIENEEDFLAICGKVPEFDKFKKIYNLTETILPNLKLFIEKNPLIMLKHSEHWEKILYVCLFFLNNPEPSIYMREIVITGVNTKFIERNMRLISSLLIFLKPEIYGTESVDPSNHGFEKRFGLLYDQPLIRFRILDPDINVNSLSDITIPISDFVRLDIPAETVFITENKVNGLAFPSVKKSMIIFGLGYGIKMLETIHWLNGKQVFFWGDIDTHGFSILSAIRSILPDCKSLLMDENILLSHKDSWIEEPEEKRFTGDLKYLNETEQIFFDKLRNNFYGRNVKLEQQLINFKFLIDKLEKLK